MTNGRIFALIAGAGCLGLSCAGGIGVIALAVLFPGKTEVQQVGGPIAIVTTAAKPVERDVIHYANVTRVKSETPARFSAPLPLPDETDGWNESSRFPPRSYVHDSICAGDDDVERRFLDALRESVKKGATAGELEEAYGETLRWCHSDGICEFSSQIVSSKEPAPIRDLLWLGLAGCQDEKWDELFRRPDVSSLAWVRRVQNGRWGKAGKPVYSAELEKHVRVAVLTGPKWERRMAAMLLGDDDDPRAAKALLSLQAQADTMDRHDIAMAMHAQSDPKAKAAFATACKAKSTDAMCDSSARGAAKPTPVPTGSVTALASRESVDLAWLVKEHAKDPELADALESCARGATYRAAQCVFELAKIDRPRAAAASKSVHYESDYLAETFDALQRWPNTGDIETRLRALDLLPAGTGGDALTPREALENGRRAYTFDVETGMWPNEHDSLLRELTSLAAADFQGVVFEEIAPDEDDMDEGEYEIRAYADGTRLSTRAENLGDWYDVEAVIGLLNVVAKERGKPVRFVTLAAYDQTATVVAGPEASLRKAVDEKLIDAGGASEAMDAGKAFEDEVMRKIESGEIDLGKN